MSAGSPRVTVVVPLYNKAATIARTLASITTQTFTDFEAIVVDDGSTDRGAAIVEASGDSRIRLIRQANAGPGAARNRAIAEARGSLVAFLDADDEWLPAFLERSIAELERAGARVVTSAFLEGPDAVPSGPSFLARGLVPGVMRVDPATPIGTLIALNVFTNSWATVAALDLVRKHGGFVEDRCTYGEDATLWLRVVLAEPIVIVLDPLVHWHSEASELSRNRKGPRDIEPFLRDPEPLYESTSPELRPLLDRFLANRAGNTATMLAFWGDWKTARSLMSRFGRVRYVRDRLVGLGYLTAHPVSPLGGRLLRTITRHLPGRKSIGSASWS